MTIHASPRRAALLLLISLGVAACAHAEPVLVPDSTPAPAVIHEPETALEPAPTPSAREDVDAIVVPLFGIDGCPAPLPSDEVPKVRVSEASHTVPLSPAIVRRVIAKARDRFASCYADTPAHADCRNVRAEVVVVVAADGATSQARARTDDAALDACTIETLEQLRFPEPEGGGAVELRFVLEYRVRRDEGM